MRIEYGLSKMSLSRQEQVEIVIRHKNRILQLTNNILDIVGDSRSKPIIEQKPLLKQCFNETISELSVIAGFCGSKERDWVNKVADSIARLTPILDWGLPPIIESYCTMINSIIIDFSKTPFIFSTGKLNSKRHKFESKISSVRKGKW